MSRLFPPEILGQTSESLYTERHTRTSALYVVMILMIVMMLAALPLVKVAITAQSRGIIRSACENNQITSACNGRIDQIHLQLNQTVMKGDTLLVINTDRIEEEMKWYREQITRNNLYIQDLNRMLGDNKDLQSLLYQSKYTQYITRLQEYRNKLEKTQREFIIHEKLHKEAVISDQLFQDKKHLYEQASTSLDAFQKQTTLQWQNELEKLQLQNEENQSKLTRFQKERDKYTITAPVSGVITQHAGKQPGNYVVPNQLIAEISPEKDLLVECYLSPAEIGLVRDSMQVSFQFDAFNYNHWGLGEGRVKDISHDVITHQEQPVFKVRCSLDTHELRLKNGYTGRLRKGMTLTARFRITRRTLFQLLYDKVDDWLNPKIQKNTLLT